VLEMAPKPLFFDEDCRNGHQLDELEAKFERTIFPVNGTNVLRKFYKTATTFGRLFSQSWGYNVDFGIEPQRDQWRYLQILWRRIRR
jgi:hypothetical protein